MKEKNLILDILTGKSDKRTHGIYLAIIMGYTAISIILAIALFPVEFSMARIFISSLGDPTVGPGDSITNPPYVWIPFNINWVVFGFGQIPHLIWIYRRTKRPKAVFQMVTLVISIIGVASWGLIGFVHNDIQPLHDILAEMISIPTWLIGIGCLGGYLLYVKLSGSNCCAWTFLIPFL